jgi:hypothetical protein
MQGLDVLPLTVGLSARNNHLGPAHYLLNVSIGGWQWIVKQKAGIACATGSSPMIYSVTAYPHTLHRVHSDRSRSDGNDARAVSLLFNNTHESVYETSHAFPKRTTNYDIHNSIGYTGHEGHCPL